MSRLDRTDPEGAVAAAAKRNSNWGRWGHDDVRGTMNFLTEDKRRDAGALIRRGVSFSLAQSFDMDGPQKGWRRRTNPVHTMLDTGTDAAAGVQGFPHGIGGAEHIGLDHLPHVSVFIADWIAASFPAPGPTDGAENPGPFGTTS